MAATTIFDTLSEAGFTGERSGGLVMRNVMVGGRRTSMRLEPPLWAWLEDVAAAYQLSVGDLCTRVARAKPDGTSLTSAVRVFIAAHYRHAASQPRTTQVRISAA